MPLIGEVARQEGKSQLNWPVSKQRISYCKGLKASKRQRKYNLKKNLHSRSTDKKGNRNQYGLCGFVPGMI